MPADGPWDAGTLTTAGDLVIQGRADGHLLAYQAATGEPLWDFDLGLGITAPPITYSVNAKQYLAILVGWGGSMAAPGRRRHGTLRVVLWGPDATSGSFLT